MNIHRRRREHEHLGRPRRHRVDDDTWTMVLMLISGVLLALTTGLCAFSALEQLGPTVGNIIVFRSSASGTDWWQIKATTAGVWPKDAAARSCSLSPSIMGADGGSLIVEERQLSSPPVYRVHWAGKHTSNGVTDCGAAADLELSRSELMRLADVAGGFNNNLRMVGP
jgi:hypothetical protein